MLPDWHELLQRFEAFVGARRAPSIVRDGIEGHASVDAAVPVVWARATIPCAAETLTRYLVHDLDRTHREWYPTAESIEILETAGDGERVIRIVNRMPFPMRAREDVYFNACKQLDDGAFVELSTSIEHARVPRRDGLVRSNMRLAGKRMAPRDDGCTDYTALWHYDVAGAIGRMPARLLLGAMLRDLVAEITRLRERF